MQGGIQLLARHARLYGDVHVVDPHFEDLIHARHVDADAAMYRMQPTFQRTAAAVRNDRHAMVVADLLHTDDLCKAVHEGHCLWRHRIEGRYVTAVVLTNTRRTTESVT
ncbi:hypothetical protein D3C71_1613130 [compost metagenome]